MADYELLFTAQAPLLFSINKPGGIFQASLPYIPGAAMRGALAARWLASQGSDKHAHVTPIAGCAFCAAFVEEPNAFFGNAYPVQSADEQPLVLPATAQACKNHAQPLFDTLIERLCWVQLAQPGLVYTPTCPICGEMTVGQSGIYVQQDGKWRKRQVLQRLLTRVAINRQRNVAEEGMLYSPFVIDEVVQLDKVSKADAPRYGPAQFRGLIRHLPEELGAHLAQIMHVGGSSSRGLGQVAVVAKRVDVTNDDRIAQRLDAFMACLKATWRAFATLPGAQASADPELLYFTITLQADAVLSRADGLPVMVYDAALLQAQTGLTAELVDSYASYDYIGGWNGAWDLPKPTAVVTKMGSTYVYRTTAAQDTVVQALQQLEREGIGQRRGEGFGQVRALHEFHLVRRSSHDNSNK